MRKLMLSLAILALPALAAAGGFKYHEVKGTFVSGDPKTNEFTIKFDDGSTSTGKAEGKAIKQAAALKPGDKIELTCKDNDKGEHLAATQIKVLK